MEPDLPKSHIFRNVVLALIAVVVALFVTYRFWVLPASTSALLFSLRDNADVRIVPKSVSAPTDPILSVENHKFQNVSFYTPWNSGSPAERESTLTIRYPDKKVIFLGRATDIFTTAVGTSTEVRDLLSPINSNYAYYEAMSNVTPSAIQHFSSNKELIVKDMLLTMKSVVFAPNGNPVYSFTTLNGMRVFQFTVNATKTFVTFFTPNDEQYDLLISGASRSEVNSILQSIKEK